MANLGAGLDGEQNETTRTARRSVRVACSGRVFEVDYPARTTAAPRIRLRIGITMGIGVEANIESTLVYAEPPVK
jgi:hypothetical protein